MKAAPSRKVFREIMAGFEAQNAEMLERPADKRPMASSWLNGERWKDEPGEPMAKANGASTGPIYRDVSEVAYGE